MLRIALAALVLTLAGPAVAQQCGIPPLPSAQNANCTPICMCDSRGQQCVWLWQCPR